MKNIILVETDDSCNMARVSLNGDLVMSGNLWDFHNGCHGIYKYGKFNNLSQLVNKIRTFLLRQGEQVETVMKEYKYENS